MGYNVTSVVKEGSRDCVHPSVRLQVICMKLLQGGLHSILTLVIFFVILRIRYPIACTSLKILSPASTYYSSFSSL